MSEITKGEYVSTSKAAKIIGVSTKTLYNWDAAGKLKCIRTKGLHRRYALSDVLNQCGAPESDGRRRICYARVSGVKQKEDLERQKIMFRNKFPGYECISDVGSGLNFKRKGFNEILDSAIGGHIEEIVVTHKDRLCRFGFDLVEKLINQYSKGKIVVLDDTETSPEKELVDDLLSVITVFSSRLHGLRSHSVKRSIRKQAESTVSENTEGEYEEEQD